MLGGENQYLVADAPWSVRLPFADSNGEHDRTRHSLKVHVPVYELLKYDPCDVCKMHAVCLAQVQMSSVLGKKAYKGCGDTAGIN